MCCSKKCCSILVALVGVAAFALKWSINNATEGTLGAMKAFFVFEKHGEFGQSTAEDIVKAKGISFKDTLSIVTGVSWNL